MGRTRRNMAKIRVEVDLLKPLHESIFVGLEFDNSPLNGYTQKLKYEGIPKYCKHRIKLVHNMINSRALEKKVSIDIEEGQKDANEGISNAPAIQKEIGINDDKDKRGRGKNKTRWRVNQHKWQDLKVTK